MSTGTLPDHYEQLAKTVRDFAKSVVAPVAAKHDAEHTFPYEVVAGMADMGLFGLPFPEEYGGMGGDYFALCLALEELGKVDQSVAITLEAGVSLGAMPMYRFGNEEQKQEWLPLLASGKALGAFGLTEAGRRQRRRRPPRPPPSWTTALGDQRHQAVHHQLRHRHHQARHGHRGDRGSPAARRRSRRSWCRCHTEGFTAEPAYNKVGWNASDTHPLSFDDVRVPQENLLGERGRGYANFLRILDEGRIAIAALSVGAAQGCVDECVKYAKEREAFGAADRHQPGHRVQDRPDGGPRPRRPHRLLRRRGADAVGQAVQEGRPRSPSWSPARPRWTTPATPPRSSAATDS